MPRPPASAPIFSWTAASALRAASFTAAATRSSSISLSSARSDGSMLTRFTSCRQVMVTLTMPAPDWPSTSTVASSSWSFFMFSCICWACLISPASCAFICLVSVVWFALLRRLDRRFDDGRVEVLDQVANERVLADRGGGAVARGVAAGLADTHRQAHRLAEVILQRSAQLVLEALFGKVLRRRRHAQLERFPVEALQLARLGELLRHPAEAERVGELGPIAVEASLALRSARGWLRALAGHIALRSLAGAAFSRSEGEHAQQRHGEAREFVRRERQVLAPMDRDLVVELHVLGIDRLGESQQALPRSARRVDRLRC